MGESIRQIWVNNMLDECHIKRVALSKLKHKSYFVINISIDVIAFSSPLRSNQTLSIRQPVLLPETVQSLSLGFVRMNRTTQSSTF